MGATKRVGELMTMACERRYEGTSYVAVRFGNVLGSNGSVIPLFRRQLENGQPLTVTHPDVTRYFMTIAEAAQLVLQASVLPEAQGRIAMLDMGEPVKIVDLARNLARLSGARLGTDVKIEFTGLRPGEKLHEALASENEVTTATRVEKVRIVETEEECGEKVEVWERMEELVRGFGDAGVEELDTFLGTMVGSSSGSSADPTTRVEPEAAESATIT
jgi:FlaA1/EpsC-like NDP-sugar epimerase